MGLRRVEAFHGCMPTTKYYSKINWGSHQLFIKKVTLTSASRAGQGCIRPLIMLLTGRWSLPVGPGFVGRLLMPLSPAAVAVDVAAAAAATRRANVVAAVTAMGVAGAAPAREVRVEDAPVADVVVYGHCRGACPSACLAGLVHGLHLQPRIGRCPHRQRPAHGLRGSSALDLTETSPPEQAQLPGLSGYLIQCT